MIINHNLPAMNTLNKLSNNNKKMNSSLEKLSSGLAINRAGDNAAGLAISEKMRGQIRGLDQASSNAQDATNMLNTAEGALGTTEDILQRMKELATQAANDTNVTSDRGEIQKEINQLTSEINRIGNTTEFNTQKLLQGGNGVALESINGITTSNTMAGGVDAIITQATATYTISGTGAGKDSTLSIILDGQKLTVTFNDDATKDPKTASNITIDTVNGSTADVYISRSTDPNVIASENGAALRDAFQKMIDQNSALAGKYNVSGAGGALTLTAVKGGAADGTQSSITSANFTPTGVTGSSTANSGTYTAAIEASGSIGIAIAGAATSTNIYNAVAGKGMTINGTQLEFYDGSKGAYKGSAQGIDIKGVTSSAGLIDAIVAQAKVDDVTLATSATGVQVKAKVGGVKGHNISYSNGAQEKDFTATFQVGANQGQSMTISIGDARAAALGIVGISGQTDPVTGAIFTSDKNVTNGTTDRKTESSLDVSDHSKATNAIAVLDKAIEKVSAERSKIGAYTNRLDYTVQQVENTSENISSSESRIRDVNMAKEMMKYQTNSILSQSAQAMLAQANQAPQNVLSLLR